MKNWRETFEVALLVATFFTIVVGATQLAYWIWATNHPGAPWWGFFLTGGK